MKYKNVDIGDKPTKNMFLLILLLGTLLRILIKQMLKQKKFIPYFIGYSKTTSKNFEKYLVVQITCVPLQR